GRCQTQAIDEAAVGANHQLVSIKGQAADLTANALAGQVDSLQDRAVGAAHAHDRVGLVRTDPQISRGRVECQTTVVDGNGQGEGIHKGAVGRIDLDDPGRTV